MRTARLVPILVLLLVATAGHTQSTKLALVGGMLLDGYEVPPVHHAAILIESGKIVAVGRGRGDDHTGGRDDYRH